MIEKPPEPRETLIACGDADAAGTLRQALRRVHPQTMLYLAFDQAQLKLIVRTLTLALILLDLDLVPAAPTELVAQVRWRSPRARVIAIAAHGSDERLLPAARAGAAGFLIKRDPPQQMTAQLRKLAAGELPLTQALARQMIQDIDAGGAPLPQPQWQALAWLAEGCTAAETAQHMAIAETDVQEHINAVWERVALRGAERSDGTGSKG